MVELVTWAVPKRLVVGSAKMSVRPTMLLYMTLQSHWQQMPLLTSWKIFVEPLVITVFWGRRQDWVLENVNIVYIIFNMFSFYIYFILFLPSISVSGWWVLIVLLSCVLSSTQQAACLMTSQKLKELYTRSLTVKKGHRMSLQNTYWFHLTIQVRKYVFSSFSYLLFLSHQYDIIIFA